MAKTADIQVRAKSGRTTQELQRDALVRERERNCEGENVNCSLNISSTLFTEDLVLHEIQIQQRTAKQSLFTIKVKSPI